MIIGRVIKNIEFFAKETVHRNFLLRCQKISSQPSSAPVVLVVLTTSGIGNAIEATPFIQALRMIWPKADITILAPPGDLFDNWIIPDRIVRSPQQIEGLSYDHTFIPYWCGKQDPSLAQTCTLGKVHLPKVWLDKWLLKSEKLYYLDMLKKIGYKGPAPPLYVSTQKPGFSVPDSDLRICIVPGGKKETAWRYKRWPYYDKLLSRLLAEYLQVQICIIGTSADDLPAGSPESDRIVDLRSRLSLSQTAWILKNSDLAIGNDCGPMHIADAVRTPSITIFGPTCEMKNSPQNKSFTLSIPLPCRPCQYTSRIKTCQNPQCINGIAPEMVIQKAKSLLNT
jgi:ADP-heptose:LPS heptosyltransferase